MIKEIAKREFTDLARDGRFRLTSFIVFALLIISFLVGWNYYESAARERTAMQESSYEQWLNQGKRNAHSATHYGIYVFKPLLPLAFIDKGIDGYTGTSTFLESHRQNESKLRPAKDIVSISRFGELSAAIVLQLFVPLLIIFLAFSTISKERETGTLRQVLSLGVSRLSLGIGKVLGISKALFILFVPAILIGTAFLFASEARNNFDYLQRGALLVVFYFVYFAAWLFSAAAISARFSSRVSLILLLGFWIFSALVVPRGLADASKRLYPTPSIVDLSREIEREVLISENERNEKLKKQVLEQYGVAKVEDLPFNFAGLDLQDSEDKGNEIIDRHYRGLNDILARQNRFQETFAVLSPTQAIRFISMGLAGTDMAQNSDFAGVAEEYRRTMVRKMNEALKDNVGEIDADYRGTPSLSRQADRETWEKVPQFEYNVPDVSWVLRNHILSIGVLFGWVIAAFAFSVWSIGRTRAY